MRVLILGATGLLGRVLVEEWDADNVDCAGSQEADIRDRSQLQTLFAKSRPECTVLAAAYADVDGCEKDPKRAHDVNCVGAINVAHAARNADSRLLFISSDYVFDGAKTVPYTPEDPVCPICIYGASKANAEHGIREVFPGCCIVRTSWLFGANGKCFPNTVLEAARVHGRLRVVDDQTGCPTFNRDLARAIKILARAEVQGTFHVTNQDPCSWYEFTRELVRVAGLKDVVIEPVATQEFPRPARRPAYSVLSPAGLEKVGVSMRSWRDTLNDYFSDREQIAHRPAIVE